MAQYCIAATCPLWSILLDTIATRVPSFAYPGTMCVGFYLYQIRAECISMFLYDFIIDNYTNTNTSCKHVSGTVVLLHTFSSLVHLLHCLSIAKALKQFTSTVCG